MLEVGAIELFHRKRLAAFIRLLFLDRIAKAQTVGEYLYWNWNLIFHSPLGDCAYRLENVSR